MKKLHSNFFLIKCICISISIDIYVHNMQLDFIPVSSLLHEISLLFIYFFSCMCLWGFTYCNPAFSARKSPKIQYMGERNHSINTRMTNRISVSIFILSMITFIGKILFTHWLSVYRAAGSCKKILSWRRSDGFPSPSSQPQQTTQQPGSALVCSHWSDLPVDSALWYAHTVFLAQFVWSSVIYYHYFLMAERITHSLIVSCAAFFHLR